MGVLDLNYRMGIEFEEFVFSVGNIDCRTGRAGKGD